MTFERETAAGGIPYLGAMFGGVLLAGAGLAAVWLQLGLPRPLCLFREWTGIPCPSCGSTRLAEALLAGDLVGAIAHNPLVFGALAGVAVWAVLSASRWAFGLPAWRLVTRPGERLALRVGAVLVLFAGWAYLVLKA